LADSISITKSVLKKVNQIESKKLLSEISKEIETVLKTITELEKVIKLISRAG